MADHNVAEIESTATENGDLNHASVACGSGSNVTLPPAEVSATPICEKCQTPVTGKQEWCRRCGWYPRLRRHVELDPWDREDLPQAAPVTQVAFWRRLVPVWGWKLVGGIGAILAASILARILLPVHGGYRFDWTVLQLVVGAAVLLAGHLAGYLFAIMENDRLNMMDFILKPAAIWITVAQELPGTFWRVALGTWGLAAILFSFIVGGLADKDIMDWGGEPAKVNLMHAITDQAQQLAGDNQDGLDKAIQDFAGKAGSAKPKDSLDKPKPRLIVDCLIIGYEPEGANDFRSLILASEVGGKLNCVGTLSDGIPAEVRAELNRRMPALERSYPFVPNRLTGKWLQPALLCRVSAESWSNSKKLNQPLFLQMLSDVPIEK